MDETKALLVLARYTDGSSTIERLNLLNETAQKRTVSGELKTYPDPYAAALAHLMHPDTVKQRTEGSVSETYTDLKDVVSYLRGMSAALVSTLPLDDSQATIKPDLTLSFTGW